MSEQFLPSFFVPYISSEITDEKIRQVFELSYEIGKVYFIDRVLKEDLQGMMYYSVYIFFESFNFDERTLRLIEHSKCKEDPPRFYYNYGEPGYWKVLLNTSQRKYNAPSVKLVLERAPCLSGSFISTAQPRVEPEKLFVPRSVSLKTKTVKDGAYESRLLQELEKKASKCI